MVLERTDSGRICRTYDQLHVGTMRVKHGAWISALGGGVEGGAVTITQTGKADKPWAMKE